MKGNTHHWTNPQKAGMPFAAVGGNTTAVWIEMRDHETDVLAKAYINAQQALEFGQAIVDAALARGAAPTPTGSTS